MWRRYAIGLGMLVIYLMTTFRHLAPVLHYQLDYTYISEVLCVNRDKPQLQCHGKCQLRRSLNSLSDKRQQKEALQLLASSLQLVEALPQPTLPCFYPPATASAPPATDPGLQAQNPLLLPPFHPPQV